MDYSKAFRLAKASNVTRLLSKLGLLLKASRKMGKYIIVYYVIFGLLGLAGIVWGAVNRNVVTAVGGVSMVVLFMAFVFCKHSGSAKRGE